jgi:HEAT repeat protein
MAAALLLGAVALLGRGQDVGTLLEALRSEDPAERRRALEALRARGAEAVPAAARALSSASPDPSARVADLVRALASPDWKERDRAMRELARLGRPALGALEAQAGAADPEVAWRVRTAAAEIRARAGREERADELRAILLCEFLGEAGDSRGVPPLLEILNAGPPGGRPELRRRAAEALGRLREHLSPAQAAEAAERVLAMLETAPSPRDRSLLVKVLARLGTPAGVRPLAALLADRSEKNVNLKRSCMAALAASGDPRGLRAVIETLSDPEVYLRQAAAAVLAERAGEDFGFDPRATAEENREALGRARAWWSRTFGRPWED